MLMTIVYIDHNVINNNGFFNIEIKLVFLLLNSFHLLYHLLAFLFRTNMMQDHESINSSNKLCNERILSIIIMLDFRQLRREGGP